ncbi:MAG: proton-conducting transporter membrane subunit [Candidatus Promineifilaceae bacterium]
MNNVLLISPVTIPLLASALSLLLWQRIRMQRAISTIGALSLLAASLVIFQTVQADGIMVMQSGGWEAPIGITFVADLLSAIMLVLTSLVGLAVILFSLVDIDRQRVAYGYYPLINVLIMGICGAFLTGDIFNLYVWFEVLLIASFVLLGLGGSAAQLQGTVKYVVINLVSSTIFLTAAGILYGLVGTLNMADMAVQIGELAQVRPGLVTTVSMLFVAAFGIKAGLFPLYFWLPASYHTPPIAVSAIFAGLLTKVGVYALIRIFTLIFVHDMAYTHSLLVWLAGLTMLSGVLGAIDQMDVRRLLSFHIVSQIGYMMMGLGVMGVALSSDLPNADVIGKLALTGAIFYIIHHIVVKANLFLIAGVVGWLRGSFDLKRLGGLIETRPYLSLIFFLSAMSLAGLPPLSGFWAKLTLVRAGIQAESYGIVGVSLVVSLLTMFSMTKVWRYAYWHAAPEIIRRPIDYSRLELFGHYLPVVMLLVVTLMIGFSAETFFNIADAAAGQLIDCRAYLDAVLGGSHTC